MGAMERMRAELWVLAGTMAVFLAACGDDGEGGDDDTLLTGLSGVIILAIVIWLIWRGVKKSRNGGV
jgi:hypothetical protein